MELAGMSKKAEDLRSLSSAVSLWLIVLVCATAFYFTSSGHEILVQASESWSAAIRVLLAQAVLVEPGNANLPIGKVRDANREIGVPGDDSQRIHLSFIIFGDVRSWRNWQTHQLEVLAVVIPWRFESSRPHHPIRGLEFA